MKIIKIIKKNGNNNNSEIDRSCDEFVGEKLLLSEGLGSPPLWLWNLADLAKGSRLPKNVTYGGPPTPLFGICPCIGAPNICLKIEVHYALIIFHRLRGNTQSGYIIISRGRIKFPRYESINHPGPFSPERVRSRFRNLRHTNTIRPIKNWLASCCSFITKS